ncbi:MAG: hypothetical protein HQK73_06995, partial [Desulfamplus sp.]|nr:hypothetical protein [Desulfamplus sp.]
GMPTAGMPTAGMPTAGMPTAGMPTTGIVGTQLPQIVAIASTGSDLNAPMASRFGTAPWFIIIDLKTGQYIPIQNTALVDLNGYGILAARLVASKGAGATIAGSYGLQEYNALLALSITPFVANAGKVLDVFNQYKQSSLPQVTENSLSDFGYASSIVTTGGAPFATDDEDDEDEEQSGYKGMPYTLPPQGKYDPTLDPANIAKDTTTTTTTNTAQLTAGLVTEPSTDLYLNLNQQSVTCVCPSCGLTYDHPAGVPCSSLLCKACGSRLISLNTGSTSTSTQTLQLSKAAVVSNTTLPQRVAIAADGNSLNSSVALRFGLANYFIIADLNTGQYTAIQNTATSNTSNYGVIAAQLVAKQGVGATIAVAYGLPSYYALKTLGINVYTANPGTVSTTLSQYRLSSLTQMNVTALPYTSTSIQTTAGTSTQRAEYCLCPICQILVPHAPGISCSDMACPQCGNRLMNSDPGTTLPVPGTLSSQTTTQLPAQNSTSQLPAQNSTSQLPAQNSTDQLTSQTQLRASTYPTQSSNTTQTSTQSQTKTNTGIVVAGQPVAGSTSLSTGLLQGSVDGSCLCPACGTTVPHVRGTACSTLACPRCGNAMIGDNTSLQVTAGMPTAGAPSIVGQGVSGMPDTAGPPPGMGQSTAGMPTAGMPTAGMPTAGMTTAGPPEGMGQSTAGMPTAGMTTLGAPEVVQGVAGLSVAGIPNISTQTVAGMTIAGPPEGMGQSTAGMPTAGMPTAGMTTAGPPEGMGQSTAGMPTAGAPEIVGQGVAGITIAGMPTAGAPAGMGPSATTVAGSNSGKICIASTGDSINSQVADIFEKAPYFLIVGFGSMEVIPNPNVSDKIGSGVQSAQLVVSEGADVVITNDIGIRAIEELNRLQVKVYTGVTGTVKDALAWYQNNRLVPTKLNSSSSSSSDSNIINDEEEQHGPPTSKAKSKGESTTL